MFDGKFYQLLINDGLNLLYGGIKGFDKVLWMIIKVIQVLILSVILCYVSFDGDQGYLGMLMVDVIYMFDDSNVLIIDYCVIIDVLIFVNISNYIYWNFGGEGLGSVLDDVLMIFVEEFILVDVMLIFMGQFCVVVGMDYDFCQGKFIGCDIWDGKELQLLQGCGYDMNWVVSWYKVDKV